MITLDMPFCFLSTLSFTATTRTLLLMLPFLAVIIWERVLLF